MKMLKGENLYEGDTADAPASTARMILGLLSKRERWLLVGLLGALLMMAAIEVAGVTSVLPFLAVAADPGLIERHEILRRLTAFLGLHGQRQVLTVLGITAFVVLTLRNAFSAFAINLKVRFAAGRNHSLAMRLLRKYLYKPYVFFLDRNSAVLARNLLAEAMNVVRMVMIPGLDFLSKSFVAVAVSILLVVANPALAAMTAGLIGGGYGIVFLLVRRKLTSVGKQKVASNRGRYRIVSEAFGGIKEVKLMGKEAAYISRFSRPSRSLAKAQATGETISKLPQYAMETLLFGGIVLFVLSLLGTNRATAEVLSTVVLYAVAAYRVMPAIRGAFSDLADLRSNGAALVLLHRELMDTADDRPQVRPSGARIDAARAIEAAGIKFRYPGSEETVVQVKKLRIAANTTVGLAGATGCGKTTLVDMLLGLLEPTEGTISVDGQLITRANLTSWQSTIGYVPQHIFLTDDSVTANIAFGVDVDRIDFAAVKRAAELAQISEFVETLPKGYETTVGERGVRLSGGQRQRIGIARSLYHDPSFVVFDEATSALDGTTEHEVISAIASLAGKKTLLIITHRLATLQGCDTVHFMQAGKIVASGTFAKLRATCRPFRQMLSHSET
jgi:ATP-binding cassette, subfamily B, bacterial PglK